MVVHAGDSTSEADKSAPIDDTTMLQESLQGMTAFATFLDGLSDSEVLLPNSDALLMELLPIDYDASLLGASAAGSSSTRIPIVDTNKVHLEPRSVPDQYQLKPVNGTLTQRKSLQNSTRRRQQEELVYLRQTVQELERELAVLKRRLMHGDKLEANWLATQEDAKHSSSAVAIQGDAAMETKDTATAPRTRKRMSMWERVAKHQLVEKQKAEIQNLKLKEMLEGQIRLAKSLEKVLSKRPRAMEYTQVLGFLMDEHSCSDDNDTTVYAMLMSKTDAVYAEVDTVCARNKYLQILDEEVTGRRVIVDENDQLYMEVTSSKIIPFTVETTSDAVWRCLSRSHVKLADGSYHSIESTDDTILAKTVMALRFSHMEAMMKVIFVTKRFVTKDRVVLACAASTHREGPREVLHGLKMMEKVWVIIQPAQTDDDGETSSASVTPSTIVQLCMRLTPSVSGGFRDDTGVLTDLTLASLFRNLEWLFQAVENILMERALVPVP